MTVNEIAGYFLGCTNTRRWRMERFEPDTVTERVAVVVMELMNGEEMTTRQVAEATGLTHVGAWYLMNRLGRIWKLRLAYVKGAWKRLPE